MSRHDAVAGDATLTGIGGLDRPRPGVWARRGVTGLLLALLALAGGGALGVHSRTVTAEQDGFRLTVTYAAVARAGLDVPLTIRVAAPEPIVDDVTVAITADYLRLFESQGFFPEPTKSAADERAVHLTFSPPPAGSALVADYDAYIQPAAQLGGSATIAVRVGDADELSVQIRTRLLS